jgi:predicted enzyme related to lactoylglutathione lyase
MTDNASSETGPVLQLRLVVEADDYEEAVRFYRDVLGLREEESFEGEDDAKVSILQAGRATLEIANPAQRRMIDRVEVGHPTTPRLRVAFEVLDAEGQTQTLVDAGASLVAPPTETPWQSLNSRLDAPGGLHITLFQERMTLEERQALEEFATDDERRS